MKLWVTKYALSGGIKEVEGEIKNGHFYYKPPNSLMQILTFMEWHTTRKSAVRRALEMRDARIASLRKQIAKLQQMTFE